MPDFTPENWITSREILEETSISRSTLNNYIRMKIVPKPLVKKPTDVSKGTKRIGYFSIGVLGRIRLVKKLKQEGNSMEDIVSLLKDIPIDACQGDNRLSYYDSDRRGCEVEDGDESVVGETLRVSIEEVRYPAYLMNYSFQVEWINRQAERKIFMQAVSLIKEKEYRNIFKLFFHWELQDLLRNWRDLV
ncbi:MAG: hypothetical protein SV775_18010, partial [Thermodesulfobacteriota bacterium]|nr:hypothetical protein [Thermodesulfobacteriota bacterium]